jgi:hypothetical protein
VTSTHTAARCTVCPWTSTGPGADAQANLHSGGSRAKDAVAHPTVTATHPARVDCCEQARRSTMSQ